MVHKSDTDSVVIYCFDSVRLKDELCRQYRYVCILKSLKRDMIALKQLIHNVQPRLILGIGNASCTQYETVAVNRFHSDKRILASGLDEYKLTMPTTHLRVSHLSTTSFCNWAMYQVSHLLDEVGNPAQHMFLHISRNERNRALAELEQLIASL